MTMTDTGYQTLTDAAPSHVESVRRSVFDPLTSQQSVELGRLATTILEHITPNSPWVKAAASRRGRENRPN